MENEKISKIIEEGTYPKSKAVLTKENLNIRYWWLKKTSAILLKISNKLSKKALLMRSKYRSIELNKEYIMDDECYYCAKRDILKVVDGKTICHECRGEKS